MMTRRPRLLCLAVLAVLSPLASVRAVTLRIVNYNIAADIDGVTTPLPGLDTVIEAIGEQSVNGVAQPPDVVALEETTSDATTLTPLLASLNAYYGASVYAASGFQATESGNNAGFGNGPNSVIYNARTLVLLGAVGVGTPQGAANGEYRQIARYEFMPVGGTAAGAFYVYVSHMKSSFGGAATNPAARAREAQILRADSALLPVDAAILYTGDFNLGGSTEAAYQTLTASGPGQGIDPVNNGPPDDTEVWDTAAYASIATESSTDLRYRDDIQFISANVYNGTISGGLRYVAGSYRVFGNNGTTAFEKSVDAATNTALAGLQGPITAATALTALTTASDHLPIVVDYTVTPPPVTVPPPPPPVTVPPPLPAVSVTALAAATPTAGNAPGVFLLTRTGDLTAALEVTFTLKGSARNGIDYRPLKLTKKIPAGKTTRRINVTPIDSAEAAGSVRVVKLTLAPGAAYTVGSEVKAKLRLRYGE